MPTRKLACRCGGTIESGSCRRCHKSSTNYDNRPSAHARGYDRDWTKTRKAFLSTQPLCEDCLSVGRCIPATDVHHIQKLTDRPDLKHDWDNLLPLCHACHSIRTARGE